MINLNGVVYTNIEDLEIALAGLSENEKLCIRNDFNGVVNTAVVNSVPSTVTPRQIRLALIMSGVTLSTIEAAIDSLPEPRRSVAKVTWEYSVEFQRGNPLIASMGPALGLTDAQIDQLFMLAATL